MQKLYEVTNKLKNEISKIVSLIEDIDYKLMELEQQKEALFNQRVSKSYFINQLKIYFKEKGEYFKYSHLDRYFFIGNFLNQNKLKSLDFNFLSDFNTPTPVSEKAIMFYFGDMMAEKLADSIPEDQFNEEMLDSETVEKEIEKIDQKINALQQERNEYINTLEEAGVNI